MKRMILLMLLAAMLAGCSGKQQETLPSFVPAAEPSATATTQPTETSLPECAFSFEALKYLEFHFNSGAGAWGTVLIIRPDGSFTGTFQDTDMGGGQSPEYPNGCVCRSDFSGQFAEPVWLNEHSCALKILDIQYAQEPGTSEIRDGILYRYDTAYGLTETEELLLYLPGKPLETLPEDYLPWAGLYGYEGTTLPHYGLYNPGHQSGFYSHNILDTIRGCVDSAEEATASVDEGLDEFSTQADMNYAAQQKYLVWDEALNQLWQDLKELLSEEQMRQLTNEELQWIKDKDAAALEAAAAYEGGSIYPTIYYGALSDLTRQRVYELLEYLPDEQ